MLASANINDEMILNFWSISLSISIAIHLNLHLYSSTITAFSTSRVQDGMEFGNLNNWLLMILEWRCWWDDERWSRYFFGIIFQGGKIYDDVIFTVSIFHYFFNDDWAQSQTFFNYTTFTIIQSYYNVNSNSVNIYNDRL